MYTQEMVSLLSEVADGNWDGNWPGAALPVQFGDTQVCRTCGPVLTKTALAGRGPSAPFPNSSGVLLPLAAWRHWISIANVVTNDNIPFEAKKDVAVWRGATTGPPGHYKRASGETVHQRVALIRSSPQWRNNSHVDVGVAKYVQGVKDQWGTVPPLTRKEMLNYKMMIVVEGNDVASATKWMMASTSAIIMPRPTKVSWLMEDALVPWQHYIPVAANFHDLPTKVDWCLGNLEACKAIGQRGRCFMQPFLDREAEKRIKVAIVRRVAAIVEASHLCEC